MELFHSLFRVIGLQLQGLSSIYPYSSLRLVEQLTPNLLCPFCCVNYFTMLYLHGLHYSAHTTSGIAELGDLPSD